MVMVEDVAVRGADDAVPHIWDTTDESTTPVRGMPEAFILRTITSNESV